MQRKDLLLLTFLLSQTTPLWAMDYDRYRDSAHPVTQAQRSDSATSSEDNKHFIVQRIYKRIHEVKRSIEMNSLAYKGLKKVIVIGRSGVGKTTLIHLLAGKPLFASKGTLDTLDPMPGLKIGHNKTSTTTIPFPCKGADDIVYWDFPGLEDTGGPEEDIVHACAYYELVSAGEVEKILVAEEETSLANKGANFLRLINYVTKLMPVEQLKDSLSLVITKQGRTRDVDILEEINQLLEISPEVDVHLLNKDVRALLSRLVAKENIATRLTYFPYPNSPGEYKADDVRAKIVESIGSLKPFKNPNVHVQLSAESKELIMNMARTLNHNIEQAIKTGFGQQIADLCQHQIKAYGNKNAVITGDNLDTIRKEDSSERNNLTEFQENVAALKTAYNLLKEGSLEDILSFTLPLNKFFNPKNLGDPNVITEQAQTLVSLKTLVNEVTYARDTWLWALQEKVEGILSFLHKPASDLVEKISDFIEDIENKKVIRKCHELSLSQEYEQNLEELNQYLNVITEAITTLDAQGNVEGFTRPLEKFFYKRDSNALPDAIKTFMIFKKLHPQVLHLHNPDPIRSWSKALEPSKNLILETIEKQKEHLVRKRQEEEEVRARAALEQQRLEQEKNALR